MNIKYIFADGLNKNLDLEAKFYVSGYKLNKKQLAKLLLPRHIPPNTYTVTAESS